MNGKKNFRVCSLKINIKEIVNIKSIVGILFPDNTMPKKNIINKKGIRNLDINFEIDL